MAGLQAPDLVDDARDLPDVPRQRRQGGHQPAPVPGVQRARGGRPRPRQLRAERALPALRRQRHRGRRALPDLRRRRLGARAQARYSVKVPAGAKDGTKIRLRGQGRGRRAAAAPPGDLIVTTRVAPSPRCTRGRATTWSSRCRSPSPRRRMGAKVEIPTLEGPIVAHRPRRQPGPAAACACAARAPRA